MRVWAVVPGPEHSGVARHGLAVAALLAEQGAQVTVARSAGAPAGSFDVTHVQFTDALFGPDVVAAADAFVTWSRQAPRPLVVTLHDAPGADPDRARDARRLPAYARVLDVVDGAVVCSAHEAAALASALRRPAPAVVPLPVLPAGPVGAPPAWAGRTTVGVLGFLYPGKGHDEALLAVADLARSTQATPAVSAPAVIAMGAVSPGQEVLADRLRAQAEALGVELVITGPLTDEELHAAARAVTVPLAAYRTLGASGSLVTWLACGRRPVVTDGPQARETAARWPGSVTVVDAPDPGGLSRALASALADPASTWALAPPVGSDVAEQHLAVFRAAGASGRSGAGLAGAVR